MAADPEMPPTTAMLAERIAELQKDREVNRAELAALRAELAEMKAEREEDDLADVDDGDLFG